MRIAIDCADLDHSRIDGTRVYIKNLLNHFGLIDQESEFFLYHKKRFNEALRPKVFDNYTERRIPYAWWWTQTRFAFELRKDNPDVCWMPIQQVPFIGPNRTKYVVTIHDLAFKLFKDHFPKKDYLKINFFTETAIKRADAIIAISNSTKKDIIKFFPNTKESKIIVIHHGFDGEAFSGEFDEAKMQKGLEEHGIKMTDEFILYVGAIQPRKNLLTLLKAFENLKQQKRFKELKFVCVGEAAWLSEQIIKKMNESKYSKDIVLTGSVSFSDLAIFYRAAKVFVYPSLYEGFGIPILEAFACQTPVICANNSSLAEVGGDAVVMFESNDSDELTSKLQKVLINDILRTEMTEKGISRASLFSWKKCAEQTLQVLKKSK